MKKFLSVLLALAVAFTFTFGSTMSAFAATPSDANVSKALALVNAVYNTANDTVEENGNVGITYDSTKTWKTTAANWDLAFEKAFTNLLTAVGSVDTVDTDSVADVLVAAGITGATGTDDVVLKSEIVKYLTNTSNGTTYYSDAAVKALAPQLEKDKTNAANIVSGISTSVYSSTIYKAEEVAVSPYNAYLWKVYTYENGAVTGSTAETYNAKAVADSLIGATVEAINAVPSTALTLAELEDAKDSMDTVFSYCVALTGGGATGDTNKDYVEDADETWKVGFNVATLGKVPMTTVQENSHKANADIAVDAKKGTIKTYINTYKVNEPYVSAVGNAKAALDNMLAAYETAETYMVENDANYTVDEIATATNNDVVNRVELAEKAIAKAASLKAEKNTDGTVTYDAEKIDKNLETVLLAVYNVGGAINSDYDTETENDAALAANAKVVYLTTAEKASFKATLKELVDETAQTINYQITSKKIAEGTGDVAYYDLEWAKVQAAVTAYNNAVDAATTEADVEKAAAAFDATMKKISSAEAVLLAYSANGENSANKNGALYATASAEFTKLSRYADALKATQNAIDNTDSLVFEIVDFNASSPAYAATYNDNYMTLVRYYIDNDARTAAEIKALNASVKAVLDGAKTNSALIAEAAAIVAQIKALPTTPTVADKAAIQAAYDAYKALNASYKKYVTNSSKLDTAINDVKTAEKNAILTAVKGLPTAATVTIADKEAVNAVVDMVDAYNETEMYALVRPLANPVADLVATIQGLELAAVKNAVNAIPAPEKITSADKAAVEAARAAYDAYVKDYADSLGDVNALKKYENTILAAEKALADAIEEEPKYDDQDAKADLLDMSRKLTIWRTSKTSIKVTAVGSVANIKDNGYTVKYSFYKKAPGATSYKLIKTTTSNKYTYTNLKKGTNKFQVKVKVYDADGKLVATKMTYYRAAKVK